MTDPTHISTNPNKYVDFDGEHSNGAIYTCQSCGTKHKGFNPDDCLDCDSTDLEWSYSYGYPGRFA